MKIKIEISRKIDKPVYKQIADEIYKNIQNGSIAGGEALPAVRELSRELGVSAGTVVAAYRLLESKRLVYSREGSGTYIGEINPENVFLPKILNTYDELGEAKGDIDFTGSGISSMFFPVREFKLALNNVLDKMGGSVFGYNNPQGVLELRKSLGERLGQQAEKIHIISGAQQGIDIIARALVEYGDCVFVEKPTYIGAVGSFLARGANVVEAELEEDGINMEQFEKLLKLYKPKVIYLMSSFQTPTCYSYSTKKKLRLIELSGKYDFYIIEEDSLSDFCFEGEKAISLKGLDYKNKVIYVKSFSKILMPGLRLGYMVMPKAVSQKAVSIKYSADLGSPPFIQYAFDEYLKSGAYNKHIEKMRSIYGKKYVRMKVLIDKYLGGFIDYIPPKGGLSFWLGLKKGCAKDLKAMLSERGVIISSQDEYCLENGSYRGFRLSFGEVKDEDMERGIVEIGRCLDKL